MIFRGALCVFGGLALSILAALLQEYLREREENTCPLCGGRKGRNLECVPCRGAANERP